jgi:DNA-binding NarL/FixJ family response regulator
MAFGVKGLGDGVRRRVLIVDDSPQVRQELRTLLPLAGDIEIVGEAADGLEAVHLAQALQPEVILMDLEMPVLDGYQAARQIKAICPACRVVALTVYSDLVSRNRATQAGVDVFLVKGVSVESLVQAISADLTDPKGCGQTTPVGTP